jgi:electron transport complex protein RnfA
MNDFMLVINGAIYAVFLHNLLFSGGLGASEMFRAAQRNSEIALTSALISVFSAASALLSLGVTTLIGNQRHIGWLSWRYAIFSTQYPGLLYVWHALIFGFILLLLYLLENVVVRFLPASKQKLLMHKRVGAAVLNTLVIYIPLLIYRQGIQPWYALGLGLGAGAAFFLVTMLVNSGMHVLRQNKAIPTQFSGVPATLIYTGLLALAFTGFAGGLSLLF